MADDVQKRLRELGLLGLAARYDEIRDQPWLATVMAIEREERLQRGLERRTRTSRIGRFKSLSDFDWGWPRRIDRMTIEELTRLAFMEEEEGDSIDLADELFMLAADASLESNFEKAIAWLEQSLAIRESLEESEFDDINMTYSTLINSYVGAEMLEEARSVTEKWLGLVEKEHGSGSWRARAPIGQLIVVYDKTGDTEQHRIWSQRMEALPEPSAMEQTSMLNFESGIIGRSLRRSLEGLGGFMQLAAESVGEGGEGDQASGSQDE